MCARQWQDNIHEHTSRTQELGVTLQLVVKKLTAALLEIRVAVAPLSAVILRVSPD